MSITQADFCQQLEILVNKFAANLDEYLSPDYTEAQVRGQFIDPFFAGLGWDLLDEAKLGPLRCEVWVEKGEMPGRPDYNFRLAARTRFLGETKPPHVKLSVAAIMQAKRYAWNTQDVYFVVLTNFAEFRLYDASLKPDPKHPDLGLIFAYRYDEYLSDQALADLWLLSREAVAGGSLETLLRQDPATRRLRVPVDQAFLADLSEWREQLAKDCYKHTPDLDVPTLNEAVQVLLDRLIFVRIAEDRRVIEADALRKLIELWGQGKHRSLRAMLNRLFEQINLDLNGEVFKPNRALDSTTFDDALVAKIARSLYEGPYDFAVIGVELLGSIYERYLGKTIRVTPKRAIVEDKPAVRKAGGVYYTPKYIVDYIVENTVGQLIAGKTPAQIAQVRVLDPACGSGSFLLGAYQKLIDYHTAYYAAHPEESRRGGLFPYLVEEPDGRKHLSIEKKAEILANTIFGVDIDPQAVEITMMSLYIKALEDETMLPRKRGLLPSLKGNIKCGNSLVGDDYVNGQLFPDKDEMYHVNPLNWQQAFPAAAQAGGFDCVIGNPPYGADLPDWIKAYLGRHFETTQYKLDTFGFFIEAGMRRLKPGGLLGYIVPNTWFDTKTYSRLRRYILANGSVRQIVNLGKNVFAANVDTALLILAREHPGAEIKVIDASDARLREERIASPIRSFEVKQALWEQDADCRFSVFVNASELAIFDKMRAVSVELGEITESSQGLIPYNTKEMSMQNSYVSTRKAGKAWKPFLDKGACISRYMLAWNGLYVKYGKWLYTPNQPKYYENDKILVQRHRNPSLQRRIVATLDTEQYYFKDNLCCIISLPDSPYNLRYILGVLNSTVMNFYYKKHFTEVSLNPIYLRQLPIPRIDFTNPAEVACHDRIVTLVERILESARRLATATARAERDMYQRLIDAADRQIDALVYELYGLTDTEIAIVEK